MKYPDDDDDNHVIYRCDNTFAQEVFELDGKDELEVAISNHLKKEIEGNASYMALPISKREVLPSVLQAPVPDLKPLPVTSDCDYSGDQEKTSLHAHSETLHIVACPLVFATLQPLPKVYGFYRRFIKDFSKIALPLCKLLQKDGFELNEACKEAFDKLKELLTSTPIIKPLTGHSFEIMCDASDYAVGAVLGQRIGKASHAIIMLPGF
ncbi:uncharacterized protein LOC116141433 [Pistacia vera]|uniref:uncharacterized protein LOC116141433 n=1 Tax=Pistacia vera TaxID=55513 RepID=UPI001263977D|nr:uncharacterized protein LOC116141433 [Pistacia vera]